MTTPAVKRGCEEENTPPKALNMPGDVCNHCKKKYTVKGKRSEADIDFLAFTLLVRGKHQYKLLAEVTKSIPNIVYCSKLNGCETRFKQLVRNVETSPKSFQNITGSFQHSQEIVSRKLHETASKIEELSACVVALSSEVESLAHEQLQSDKSVSAANPLHILLYYHLVLWKLSMPLSSYITYQNLLLISVKRVHQNS